MPIYLDRLPAKKVCADQGPRRIPWLLGFLIWMLLAILLVLGFWPKGVPTQTLLFWLCLLLLPLLPFLAVFTLRMVCYGTAQAHVQRWNLSHDVQKKREIIRARQPLWLLQSAYYSPLNKQGLVQSIQQQESALSMAEHGDEYLFTARLNGLSTEHEHLDQPRLFALLCHLLQSMRPMLLRLPQGSALHLRLTCNSELDDDALLLLGRQAWQTQMPKYETEPLFSCNEHGLMDLDRWLDEREASSQRFTLYLSTHLHEAPPADSGEAGVALLLAPVAIAQKQGFTPQAIICRPEPVQLDMAHALENSLCWAGIQIGKLAGIVCAGLSQEALNTAASILEMPPYACPLPLDNMDKTVGGLGDGAPWLGLAACAETGRTQLLISQDQQTCWVVIHPAPIKK